MNIIKVLIMLLFLSSTITAQGNGIFYILKGNLAIPKGDLVDDDHMSADGFASPGYGGGLELQYIFNPDGLGLFLTGDVLINSADSEKLNALGYWEYNFQFTGEYRNIPILGGLLYSIQINPTSKFHLKAGAGINYFEHTGFEWTYDNPEQRFAFAADVKRENSDTFAFKLAGSLIIDLFLLELSYLNLGEAEYKQVYTEYEYGYIETETTIAKMSLSMVTFSAGVRF